MTFTENPCRFLRKLKMRQNNTVFHFWWESLLFFDNFAFFFAESMFYVKNFQNWKNHYKNRWFYKSRGPQKECRRRSRFAICGGRQVTKQYINKSVVTKQYINFGVACCSRSLVVRGRLVLSFAVAWSLISRSLVVARELEGGSEWVSEWGRKEDSGIHLRNLTTPTQRVGEKVIRKSLTAGVNKKNSRRH